MQDAPASNDLPKEWEAAYTKAATLLRMACLRAAQQGGYGEVITRIPYHGPKGPGREAAELKETFV